MEAAHFDQPARPHAHSRRQTLLAIVLGGALAARPFQETVAQSVCTQVGERYHEDGSCCSDRCRGQNRK